MLERISGYLFDNSTNPIQNADLLDFSNFDGAAYDVSKKIRVDEFINFIPTFYTSDGTLTNNREVNNDGNTLTFLGGDVKLKQSNLIDEFAYVVQDSLGNEQAKLGYNQTDSRGYLRLIRGGIDWLTADNGNLNVAGTITNTNSLSIGGVSIIPASLSMPVNYKIIIDGTARLGVANNNTYLDAGGNGVIDFRDWANRVYGTFEIGAFSLFSLPADSSTIVSRRRSESFNIVSRFWNGSQSVDKVFKTTHEILDDPSGDSVVNFEIDGNTLFRAFDTAKLEFNGEIETLGAGEGLIMLDRTNGNRYRIFMDNGILNSEIV